MIEYITYKKKKLPVSIAYYALMKFKEETGKTFEEVQAEVQDQQQMDLEYFEILLYHGLVAGAEAMDEEFDLPREKGPFILDQCFWEFVEMFPKFFPKEEAVKKLEVPSMNRRQRRTKAKEANGKKST